MNYEYTQIREHLATYDGVDQQVYTDAQGVIFTDETGRKYINMNDISCVLGYNHPKFTETVSTSARTKVLGHMGVLSKDKETLIGNFMEKTHGDFHKIFFAGSGGEVVDWSLKVARRYTGREGIVSFQNALHGRSFAGAYISGIDKRKAGFGTGLEQVHFWEYPEDGRTMEPSAEAFQDVAAVIIEPYQALGGMVSPSKEYWRWLRAFTKQHGIVLILDEIQTGFGKTGSMFAYEEAGIVPDILLAGKGMSNGFGLGAMLMSQEVGASVRPFELSGGSADNDFMCSVVNAVFSIYKEDQILDHVNEMGELLRSGLEEVLAVWKVPARIHGKGLFLGVDLPEGMAEHVVAHGKSAGVLLGRSGNRLLLRPPLVIGKEEIQKVCCVLKEA